MKLLAKHEEQNPQVVFTKIKDVITWILGFELSRER
jgi:hypothetical protein